MGVVEDETALERNILPSLTVWEGREGGWSGMAGTDGEEKGEKKGEY